MDAKDAREAKEPRMVEIFVIGCCFVFVFVVFVLVLFWPSQGIIKEPYENALVDLIGAFLKPFRKKGGVCFLLV